MISPYQWLKRPVRKEIPYPWMERQNYKKTLPNGCKGRIEKKCSYQWIERQNHKESLYQGDGRAKSVIEVFFSFCYITFR